MLAKSLENLAALDLQALVDDGVAESVTLEFKREIPEAAGGGSVKILREITALANTNGGDLIYGVAEQDSVAAEIAGIDAATLGAQQQRIENLLRDGVDPPLRGVRFQPVGLATEGRAALVVRVPKSWSGPHRVTTGGHAHFYGRNAKESYPLDVAALHESFGASDAMFARAHAFQTDRIIQLSNRQTVRPLERDGALLVYHMLPLASFAPASRINLWPPDAERFARFTPALVNVSNQDPTFEGFVLFTQRRRDSVAYCHVHRSGCIEVACVLGPIGEGDDPREYWIESPWIEQFAIFNTERFAESLNHYGVSLPYLAALKIIGGTDYRLNVQGPNFQDQTRLGRGVLELPPAQIESTQFDSASLWKDSLDRLYNAFGREGSPFWRDGRWTARR